MAFPVPTIPACADEPEESPSADAAQLSASDSIPTPRGAAGLVQKVIDDEAKIADIRSLYLRFEGKWTHTPLGIAKGRADLEKQFPGMEISPKRFQNLRPEIVEELEIAFDDRRVRKHSFQHDVSIDTRVWDGKRAIIHEKYFTHTQEHFAFDARPERYVTGRLLLDLGWQRMGPPAISWLKSSMSPEELLTSYGRPEDFNVVREEEYRGRQCDVVENRVLRRRYWIDKEEGRLRGLAYLFVPRQMDPLGFVNRIYGRHFQSVSEADSWMQSLTQEEREKEVRTVLDKSFELARPMSEFILDDYRELVPGVWIPARQGYVMFDTKVTDDEKSEVVGERELRLVEAKANEDLPDSLFEIELVDGVQVNDWGHDPPLFYKHKRGRSPEEWQAIIEQHERENAEWKKQQAVRDALHGRPAFPFPKSHWLNSEPLDWPMLRGKVVILHFWAHWCGPCHNDLPVLSSSQKQGAESPIVIIGVHAPGSDVDDIEKDVQDYNLTYPIVIDESRPHEPATWGRLSHEYGINSIPFAVLIDADGKVAGNGQLNEVLGKAAELASKQKTSNESDVD